MLFEDMPIDIVKLILDITTPRALLNWGLVSLATARLTAKKLPRARCLKIAFTNEDLLAGYDGDEARIQLPSEYHDTTRRILSVLIPSLSTAVQTLHLENELIEGSVTDADLANILEFVREANLKTLAFSEIDLKSVRIWTLALIAGFNGLEKLEIEQCQLGGHTEASMLRCLQSSFSTLSQIDLKGTPQITDTFSLRVARSCPNLIYFRISYCPRVTTISALQLIESTYTRHADKLDVHMNNTKFDSELLRKYMSSPLFALSPSEWHLKPMVVPIAYDKPALLALHSSRKCVMIFV